MCRRAIWTITALLLVTQGACVDTFSDTRIQANIWMGADLDRDFLVLPTPGLKPHDPSYFSHYEIHANIADSGYVRLLSFLIQPALHTNNPCLQFFEDDLCVDAEYPCDQYINMKRYSYLESIYALVTPAETQPSEDASNLYGWEHYPGYDFFDWPWFLFNDPTITDEATKLALPNLNQDELDQFCQWCLPRGFYLGNPLLLTKPLQGEQYGVVDGPDPRSGAMVGGITLFLPGKVSGMTEFMILREKDPGRLSAENINRADLLPSADSQVFLIALSDESFGYIDRAEYRGVTSVFLESPYQLPIWMHAVIYEDIDDDPIGI
ncbi:MAG: hypothetical protein ABI333_08525 [bacterium]